MYLPPHFHEQDSARLHGLIRARPLGLLITNGPGGLNANPIPFLLDAERGPHGTLRAHVARANPVWQEADGAREALVVFQDVDSYITPAWYASKREHGRVVPTWNYAMVHVYGPLTAIDDAAWLHDQISALTNRHEASRAESWAVTDAPEKFVDAQVRGIVGIEIPIARMEGKWKVSQNRSDADRDGVADGLREIGGEDATRMAEMVESAGR